VENEAKRLGAAVSAANIAPPAQPVNNPQIYLGVKRIVHDKKTPEAFPVDRQRFQRCRGVRCIVSTGINPGVIHRLRLRRNFIKASMIFVLASLIFIKCSMKMMNFRAFSP
jgi:hypothetical protein